MSPRRCPDSHHTHHLAFFTRAPADLCRRSARCHWNCSGRTASLRHCVPPLQTETDHDGALEELRDSVHEAIVALRRFGGSRSAVRFALESVARQTLSADTTPDEEALAGVELVDQIARQYLESQTP